MFKPPNLGLHLDLEVKDTICFATTQRQLSAVELAEQVDAMVVIGGRNSSNTTRLFEICAQHCSRAHHIERAEEIDFSDLYETSAQLLIVKAGNADTYSTKESLVGLKVGAQKGTIQSQLIQSALPESELFELEKYPALALEDQAVGEALVATSNGALEVSNFTFTAEEASFGKSVVIAKGNEDLVAVVNEVINKVIADGSYQKAYDEAVELAASLGL